MDLQKHLEKIENQRKDPSIEDISQNFSDFKPEHKHIPKPPDNSIKYSYSITNKNSIDSFQPQYAFGNPNNGNVNELSNFSKLQKQHGTVSYTMKKGNVNSEKIFKKNKIQQYNLDDQNITKGEHTTSLFRPRNKFPNVDDYLNLTDDALVSKNPAPNITNLADESMGVSKNMKGDVYSDFLKFPVDSHGERSKNSQKSDQMIFFDDSSNEPIMNF
jgi:hypothetical protein